MSKDEFERLKNRFGEDLSAWPAPYRQQATAFSRKANRDTAADDGALDQLVLEAVLEPTDERRIARQVLVRIGQTPQSTSAFLWPMPPWSWPAVMASAVLILATAAAGGYFMAGSDGGLSDDVLLAFATGEPPASLVESVAMNRANGG